MTRFAEPSDLTASEIRVARDRRALTVVWADGRATTYGASELRRSARSADAVRAELDRADAVAVGDVVENAAHLEQMNADVSIQSVALLGNYAINIEFSDGHRRGIYPWAYLAQLAHASDEFRA